MKYFCTRCDWEGDTPKVQFIEAPDMSLDSYIACPVCHGKAQLTDPSRMRYNHKYPVGAYQVEWT